MSLDAILRTAVSGLNTSQAALRTTADNVSNVNTPGYARKEVTFVSQSVGGQGAGVEISEVRRVVDLFLQSELVRARSDHALFDVQAELHDRLQTLLGAPDSPTSLGNLIDEAFVAIGELALDPSSTARRLSMLDEVKSLADEIGRIARQVQDLRKEADRQIAADINTVNSALEEIFTLNGLIREQKLNGQQTAALEERRSTAIEAIADVIDIRTINGSDGVISLATVSGLPLLDTDLYKIQYSALGQVDAGSRFQQITVNKIDKVSGAVAATGEALEGRLRAGSLRGLIDMRDENLVDIAIALGELSAGIVDQLNVAHNQGTAVPPPNTLTGRNTGSLGTDAHGFTGQVTFAVLDANLEISSQVGIDFSNPGLVTLNDVIAAVNGGLTGATMSLTNGVLTFDANAGGDGVSILQPDTNASSRGGRGFSHFFGLNDLMQARSVPHFDTGLTGAGGHVFGTSGTVNLEFRGPGADVPVTHTLDFSTLGGSTISDIVANLNTGMGSFVTFSLDATGKLVATPASGLEKYSVNVVNDTSNRGSTGVSFTDLFGLGSRPRMEAAFDIGVKPAIVAQPMLLASAKLDTGAASGIPALSEGDNRGVLALQAVQTAGVWFMAAGDLPSITTEISDYAATLLNAIGNQAASARTLAEDRSILKQEITIRRDSVSGVNLDEELANMIIYQNSYNAAARIISTANEMFDALLQLTA